MWEFCPAQIEKVWMNFAEQEKTDSKWHEFDVNTQERNAATWKKVVIRAPVQIDYRISKTGRMLVGFDTCSYDNCNGQFAAI